MRRRSRTVRWCRRCESEPVRRLLAESPECRLCRTQSEVSRYGSSAPRRNREYYLAKARKQRASALSRSWEFVLRYLQGHPCIDCQESDPRVLEFDHRDPATKRAPVSVLVAEGYGLDAIAQEIAKCDVRCANCHRIRTRERAGWFMSQAWRARRDSNSQPFDP